MTTGSAHEDIEAFGPSPETYLLIVLAALPLMAMIGPWLHGSRPTRDVLAASGVILFVLYAVRAFQITLSTEGIRYRSPFGRPPPVRWSSITNVRTGARLPRTGYPAYFMEIHAEDRQRPVVINIKFFGRRGLARVATLISERVAQARLDQGTRDLAKGTVPSVFFEPGGDERPS